MNELAKPITVDASITPLPKEKWKAPSLVVGGEFFVSFGSNRAFRCSIVEVIKEALKTKVKIALPDELPILKAVPILYADEIGATPEEAIQNAVQRVLYVGNLSSRVTNEDLRPLFEQAGKVDSVEVIFNRATRRSKGFAFVTMVNEEAANAAIKLLEGVSLKGKSMILSLAPDKSLYENNDNANTGFW